MCEKKYIYKRIYHLFLSLSHQMIMLKMFSAIICYRSSRPEVFWKKGALRACNFIKKETLAQVFSCEFCEIFKNTFSHRTPLVAASVVKILCIFQDKRTNADSYLNVFIAISE